MPRGIGFQPMIQTNQRDGIRKTVLRLPGAGCRLNPAHSPRPLRSHRLRSHRLWCHRNGGLCLRPQIEPGETRDHRHRPDGVSLFRFRDMGAVCRRLRSAGCPLRLAGADRTVRKTRQQHRRVGTRGEDCRRQRAARDERERASQRAGTTAQIVPQRSSLL